jgi:hypothetical protein
VGHDFKASIEGHLVSFDCGHRGQPSRIEEKRISRLLRKSTFIPMLEEISGAHVSAAQEERTKFKANPKP